MGWTIGHEITHMFDDDETVLDEDRRNCLINQYSSYIEKSINQHLNGTKTLFEDISDTIGLKMAYEAYIKYINYVGDELKLPGLEYTAKQLFWIASAQDWCSASGTEYLKSRIKSDDHTLGSWRVIGTLSNMADFSKDFKCSENSKMNPMKKCEIWK